MNVLAAGDTSETVPTVGLNVKVVKKGGVTMKMWDLAGQSAYRSEWSRYARGVDAIVFVVDVADSPRVAEARRELHRLLEDTTLAATPILIAANKVDISPHMPEQQLIKELNLVRGSGCCGGSGSSSSSSSSSCSCSCCSCCCSWRRASDDFAAVLCSYLRHRFAPPLTRRTISSTIPGLSCPSRQSTSRTWMSS
jgi:GTPase SAR1 family protein